MRIDLYNKEMQWQRPLGAYKHLTMTPVFNDISTIEFTVKTTHPALPLLLTRGTRAVVKFRERTLSGWVRVQKGSGPEDRGEFTFTVQDDYWILNSFLGYQNPEGNLTNSTTTGQGVRERLELKGPAETVLKEFWQRNVMPRANFPVTMEPDLGRGNPITVSTRMHKLWDQLKTPWETSGLGISIYQKDGAITLDVYEPRVYPNPVTERNRMVQGWDFEGAGPEATTVVVGGQGEGVLREFYGQTDAALETAYGYRVEVFQDARDTADGETHAQRAAATLAEGVPVATANLKLAESGKFRFATADGVNLGDVVDAEFGPSLTITDVIRSATISHTPGDGLKVISQIGSTSDPERIMQQAITRLAAGVRDLKASR